MLKNTEADVLTALCTVHAFLVSGTRGAVVTTNMPDAPVLHVLNSTADALIKKRFVQWSHTLEGDEFYCITKEGKNVLAAHRNPNAHVTKISKRGGHGVDIGLYITRSDANVFWSEQGNSYVIVPAAWNEREWHTWRRPDGERVVLLSINGIGEIRWVVPHNGSTSGDMEAATYFGLSEHMHAEEVSDTKRCECENTGHFNGRDHDYQKQDATHRVTTVYGKFYVCGHCRDVCLKDYVWQSFPIGGNT